MIRKFLVVGRQIYLTSQKKDTKDETIREVEVLLPIETFWKVEKVLSKADYLIAASEDKVELQETYKLILSSVAPYAVSEKDRKWLRAKIGAK